MSLDLYNCKLINKLIPSLVEIGLLVLEKIFEKYSVNFYSFAIISP
jgi:hypothetical protein